MAKQSINGCSFIYTTDQVKTEIIKILSKAGYSTKDLAELMEVSMPAASRYLHGSLLPSNKTLCKTLNKIKETDRETYFKILAGIAELLWNIVKKILQQLEETESQRQIEKIADEIALLLYHAKK